MAVPYLVTGNNLFKQWFSNEGIIENFENWSKIHSRVSCGINLRKANLVNICWSYNIFQNNEGYFTTGAWGDNESLVTKLDISEKPLDPSKLIVTSNDSYICVVDTGLLKVWRVNVGETIKYPTLDANFKVRSESQQHLKISKVISSNSSIAFLTNTGHVFCELPPVYLDTSHCVGKVCDIVCGYGHFILLTTTGHVYTWGCGQRLQLGHGKVTSVDVPTEVKALAGLKIIKIAAGGTHSLALSESGDVYTWGWNEYGQLGVRPENGTVNCLGIPSCPIPALVDILDESGQEVDINVLDIACGSRHSVIRLEDNSVWATGCNKYGQLGLPRQTYPSVKYFQKVLQCDIDFDLMCGTWTTVILKK